MAPKKKGQKMDLGSFLADETTGGSWADEMEALPTGPSGEPTAFGQGGLGGSHLSRQHDRYGGGGGDRFDGRPARVEIPIPNEPPYTAFAGNLSFETTEGDLEDFFAPLKVTSVRLVMGPDARPKGFGYVEFESQSDLKEALARSGSDLTGRMIRIGVAEPPKQREGRADDEPTWERKGPLPPQERRGFSGGGFRDAGGFGSGAGGPPRRDFEEAEREGPIRGGKFVPSADPGPQRRTGGGFERSFSAGPPAGAVDAEREGPIRGGKFVPSQAPAPSSSSFRRTSEQQSSRADEAGWQRSGPLPSSSSSPSSEGAPQQRQKLQLSARSANADATAATTSNKPSPFGAAKPINTAERERQIEEKLQAQAAAAAKPSTPPATSPSTAPGTTTVTTSGNPFGGAKPINTAVREREVEDKLRQSRAEPTRKTSSSGASAGATSALRKEGFSYAAAGSARAPRRPSASNDNKPAAAAAVKENGAPSPAASASPSSSPKQKDGQGKSLIAALEETTI